VLSNYVVNSLVKDPANKPAVQHAFAIGTSLLYDLAIAMITYGLLVVVAAWLAGYTRPARAVRRALAPSLREHVQYVYAAAALALLLVVVWGPFPSTREVLPVIGFVILLGLGIHTLRGMTAQEFPDAQLGDLAHGIRAWYDARRHAAFSAISAARSASVSTATAGGEVGGAGDTRIGDLERLANLHDRGVLTDEEFRLQKTALLQHDT